MDASKRLYDLDKRKVYVCMIVDMFIFLLPAIIYAVVWGYLESQYLMIEDKSSVDVNPHFFGAMLLFPFVPISLGAPLTAFYIKLWKRPVSFWKIFFIALVPFIPGFIVFSLFLFIWHFFALIPLSCFLVFFLLSFFAILWSEKEKFL